MQKLTVSRVVHWNESGEWRAAICTYVFDEEFKAELYVFPCGGAKGKSVFVDTRDVDDGEGANNDEWRWPPRSN